MLLVKGEDSFSYFGTHCNGSFDCGSDWCKCDSCWLYPLVLPLRCDRESKFLILLISETSSLDGVLVSSSNSFSLP